MDLSSTGTGCTKPTSVASANALGAHPNETCQSFANDLSSCIGRQWIKIFAVQDEVVREIVTVIPGRLDAAAIQLARNRPTDNLAAYEPLLRAWQVRNRDLGSA